MASLPDDCRAITVCSSVIQCTDVVRDLGVLLDSEMSMQRHISKVTSVCFYAPSKAASDSEICQSISHGTTCDVTRHHTH